MICKSNPCVGDPLVNCLLPCYSGLGFFNPFNQICFPWYKKPISNLLKSQLIIPKVLSRWVPNTIPQPPKLSKLKLTLHLELDVLALSFGPDYFTIGYLNSKTAVGVNAKL